MQVKPMRVSLWIIQGLAAFFLVKSVLLGLGWVSAQDIVAQHVQTAFLALLLALASHIGTAFYVIGTKRILMLSKQNLGFDAPMALVRRNRNIIRRTIPLVTLSILFLMVGFILGGAADTGAVSFRTHGAIAIAATIVNVVTLIWEAFMTQRNHHVLVNLRVKEMEHQATLPA